MCSNSPTRRILAQLWSQVCKETIRKRSRKSDLRSRRPVRKPRLALNHRRNRSAFMWQHSDWGMEQCSSVLFSDEPSRFRLIRCDSRFRVRAPASGELHRKGLVQEVDKFEWASDTVWVGISFPRPPLVVIAGRKDFCKSCGTCWNPYGP